MAKGVSPLVASVLLIAATMSIAGILAYWTSGFVKTSLPEVNQTQEQCKYAGFKIYSCAYNTSTSILSAVLNNYRTVDLKDLMVYASFPNGTISSGVKLNETLVPGQLKTYILNNFPQNFTKIIVSSPICPGLAPEDSGCTVS
jgi:FlaG/FlaF family flagellin (archaellin)